ncbi:TetR/AcrR family transcriptional regulator [Sphingosinicella terrae]|uniref:TetR/AcrR family transcriptional regulator n=1 Tax=Sphingosinicella terrae TaxID=2172047 RepID=UPI000E0DB62C|nr:TetR/AcrR family transcriptional regulator [Sphingosinicella terrae]
MAPVPEPRWRRRKEARPADIVAAALELFTEKGFAAARLDEIARRAGVSKGTLYLYFDSKEALFRAVVRDVVVPNVEALRESVLGSATPFPERLRELLPRFAAIVTALPIGAVAKMVIGESRNFPELAKVWHDDVILKSIGLLVELLEAAQARGEVRAGNPRIQAFSIMGPMLLGILWRETFTPIGGAEVDLVAAARQHAETVIDGLSLKESAR